MAGGGKGLGGAQALWRVQQRWPGGGGARARRCGVLSLSSSVMAERGSMCIAGLPGHGLAYLLGISVGKASSSRIVLEM
jgi:hypothetical protein